MWRIVFLATTWPDEFQMWMPLPRRFWLRSTSHSSLSAGVPRAASGSIGCSTVSRADDRVAFDAHAVGLPDVDAVQRVVDAVVDDHGAGAGDVDGGVVVPEVEAGAADLEAVERDVGGANRHGVRAAVAEEVGARSPCRRTARSMMNGPR